MCVGADTKRLAGPSDCVRIGLVVRCDPNNGLADESIGPETCAAAAAEPSASRRLASMPSQGCILGVAAGEGRSCAEGLQVELGSCSGGDGDLLRKDAFCCCQATGADAKRCKVVLGELWGCGSGCCTATCTRSGDTTLNSAPRDLGTSCGEGCGEPHQISCDDDIGAPRGDGNLVSLLVTRVGDRGDPRLRKRVKLEYLIVCRETGRL